MTLEPKILLRLQFLVRVVRKECRHLVTTDQRLFGNEFSLQQAAHLEEDLDLAERVEAFVGRFGRLQDTLGDKLLPLLLAALGENASSVIDNLDRAERWASSSRQMNGWPCATSETRWFTNTLKIQSFFTAPCNPATTLCLPWWP